MAVVRLLLTHVLLHDSLLFSKKVWGYALQVKQEGYETQLRSVYGWTTPTLLIFCADQVAS